MADQQLAAVGKVVGVRRLLRDLAVAASDDYTQAFKVLGMVVFVQCEGVEPLLGGRLIRESTFFRWVDQLRASGWGDLICGDEYRQALERKLAFRARISEALSPQAAGPQASGTVKGDREAQPSTLDGVAAGGSLQEATAPAGPVPGESWRHG